MEILSILSSVSWHSSGAHVHNEAFITASQQATGLSPSLHPAQADRRLIIQCGVQQPCRVVCVCMRVCLGDLMQTARDSAQGHVLVCNKLLSTKITCCRPIMSVAQLHTTTHTQTSRSTMTTRHFSMR